MFAGPGAGETIMPRISGIAAALLAGTLLLVTALPVRAELIEEIVAWVDGDIITNSQLEDEEQAMLAEAYRQFTGEELDENVKKLREELLLRMVDRKILLHRAEMMFDVDKMGEAFYEGFLEQQGITDEAELQQALAREGMSIDDLKERLTEMFAPEEVLRHEVGSRVAVTDSELQTYYEEHPEDFTVEAEVTVREIVLLVDDDSAKEARRIEMVEIHERVTTGGEEFAEVAKEVSEAGTAEDGGLLGPLHKGEISEQLEAPAFTLAIGEVSEVMEAPYGFHIIMIESRSEDTLPPIDEVGDDLRKWLENLKFYAEREVFMEKARTESEWCVKPKYSDRLPADSAEKVCKDL